MKVIIFISHGLTVISIFYMLFIHKFEPKIYSLYKSLAWLKVLFVFALSINLIMDTNYLYIIRKPSSASIMR